MASFPKRSVTCGELRAEDEGRSVVLNGWVDAVRDHGGLLFVDVRDRWGVTQVVVDPDRAGEELVRAARSLKPEWVVAVGGVVRLRPEETRNPGRPTGDVEVEVHGIEILAPARTPPFEIRDDVKVSDELRLRYRYLDLRRPALRTALEARHRFFLSLRRAFAERDFIEIETPMLTRMTPEGSREYIVPSRLHPGKFYALPQSPQVFKQLCMIGGIDRYFQIARCLRDEDLRADRQPEFTQLDLELSFAEEEDVFTVVEEVVAQSLAEVFGRQVETPFPRMPYAEAMERFGLDKPDLRFGVELRDLAPLLRGAGFRVVDGALEAGGEVRGLVVEQGAAALSRKQVDELAAFVGEFGAKGLAFVKRQDGQWSGPLARFLDEERRRRLESEVGFGEGDLLLVVADRPTIVRRALGELRNELARRLGWLEGNDALRFVWVTDFPMFEWSEEEGRWVTTHHPFTMPLEESEGQLEREPERVRARAYDLVLNGWELGSGSVRIHRRDLQARVFRALGISQEEAQAKFGFFLEAFEYGAPPHAGIALGLERLLAVLLDKPNIRELVAFPKTASASCPLTGAPAEVPESLLEELGLALRARTRKEDAS